MTTKTKEDTSRILNSGKDITLKACGDITIKEPTLEQTLRILNDLVSISGKFTNESDIDENTFLRSLLIDSEVRSEVERIASACCDIPIKTLKTLGISDWMRIIAGIKEVIDWEDLKELFFQVVPPSALQSLTQGTTKTDTTVLESVSEE